MKKLVIFDLDGTLLNTIYDLGEAVNFALRTMGYAQHPVPAYNYMVGNGVKKLIERAQPDADEATREKLLEHFREYYDTHNTVHTKPYKGIPELLERLRAEGVDVAVASNKYESATKALVAHYFPHIDFCTVQGQIPNRPTKPDPTVIFDILSQHPTPKSQVLYVGDSNVDIETARRACVESIGVAWGFRPTSELIEAHADHIATDPSQILGYLNDMF